MTKLRIYDLDHQALAIDLHHLLDLLAPRCLDATWLVSTVKTSLPGPKWFEATGEGGKQLEQLAQAHSTLSGRDLAALAKTTRQVIWGEFVGSLPEAPSHPWVTIRAVDSTFYEVTTFDDLVLHKIRSSFNDVQPADAPFA